jgi:hypothetical protein
MLEIHAQEFVAATQALMFVEGLLLHTNSEFSDEKLNDKELEEKIHLHNLSVSSAAVGAKETGKCAKRLHDTIEQGKCTHRDLARILRGTRELFSSELEDAKMFGLTSEEVSHFENTVESFGFDIAAKFSSLASEDIDEAGKCLALDRNTACVFHLMRAMEQALKALGLKLGLQNVEIEWGPLLGAIDDKIKAMPRGPVKYEWSECRANLYHVKQAWRNSTMHPKETYTNAQARQLLHAVRAFMEQLATLV